MVRKEIYAHMIAYNLIRDLIVTTASRFDTAPKLLSHKGATQVLNAFAEKLNVGSDNIDELEAALYESILEHPVLITARDFIPRRPGATLRPPFLLLAKCRDFQRPKRSANFNVVVAMDASPLRSLRFC